MSAQSRSHQDEANSLASVSFVKFYRNLSATPIDDSGNGLTSLARSIITELIGTDRAIPLVVLVDIVEPPFETFCVFIGLYGPQCSQRSRGLRVDTRFCKGSSG